MSVIAVNPILSGFYPDPSICAVGEDYYLVNSTFAYFPGLPVMHSRDLAHWEQLGNACNRQSQLPLQGCGHSEGLFAPTIRYHDGMFYIICTNISGGGNFIITADNPAGPWSEPYFIKGADGIDPSLFFDEDGVCYYIGTHPNPKGCRYDGDWHIWIQELDIERMELVGKPEDVWSGAMKNVIWPEGPHLYKKDGYYYIMHAEGGTGPNHAVTVCRSRNIWGPYENNFCNPVLTHRHLGKDYPVRYVGHADMIETPAGEWYMTMLAVRQVEGYTMLGRETFLARVVWEDGWPVVNPGVGKLTEKVQINLPEWKAGQNCGMYDFAGACHTLGNEFLFLRNPDEDMYRIKEGEGLYLKCSDVLLNQKASPSYIAVRQRHHQFTSGTLIDIKSVGENRAGIALVQSNEYYLRLEVSGKYVSAILCEMGNDRILESAEINSEKAVLFIRVSGLTAVLGIREENKERIVVENVDIRGLSTEIAGGFTGCTTGIYATAKTIYSDRQEVRFLNFSYQEF